MVRSHNTKRARSGTVSWESRLFSAPVPQTGYRYDLPIFQMEFSLTQVLDGPVTGHILFGEVIQENLNIGRPKQVQLIFDHWIIKIKPGLVRTRVINDGVVPSLHVDQKAIRDAVCIP